MSPKMKVVIVKVANLTMPIYGSIVVMIGKVKIMRYNVANKGLK